MDIKRSFKRFKKNYIRESEVLDNEDFVDVDLEGTTEDTTGKVYTIEVASVITDEDSDAQNVQTYENVTAEELIEKLGEEKANEFFTNREITVDFPFDDNGFFDGAEEYAWYIESESDIEYTDPEENLDDGYDTDFNESAKRMNESKDNAYWVNEGVTTLLNMIFEYNAIGIGTSKIRFEKDEGSNNFIECINVICHDSNIGNILIDDGQWTFVCDNEDVTNCGSFNWDDVVSSVHDMIDKLLPVFAKLCRNESRKHGYKIVKESCCCGGKKKSKKGKKDKKSKFVPFWAKKKDKELKEALKTLKDAGYSIINESGVDSELEDDATGFGIVFDDSDYYTEDGECEVCAICGNESCDGEYDEDGNFVCSDCAENSLEQPMEEIDPMDIYFRAGRADNIRDMHRFDR